MKTIRLKGAAGSGKTTRAEALYREHTSKGLHVLVEDEGCICHNSLPERRMSAADLLIITQQTNGPLTETTED